MASFKDRTGRVWQVEITVHSLRQVRQQLNVNLATLTEDNFSGLNALFSDVELLVNVLYLLCRDQAEKDEAGNAQKIFDCVNEDGLLVEPSQYVIRKVHERHDA